MAKAPLVLANCVTAVGYPIHIQVISTIFICDRALDCAMAECETHSH